MNEFLVTCIALSTLSGGHEHITAIGGPAGGGWTLSKEAAIQQIESKSGAFYTVDPASGKKAYVGVVREPGKASYLRTHSDGVWNNNLLAQTACPISYRRVA